MAAYIAQRKESFSGNPLHLEWISQCGVSILTKHVLCEVFNYFGIYSHRPQFIRRCHKAILHFASNKLAIQAFRHFQVSGLRTSFACPSFASWVCLSTSTTTEFRLAHDFRVHVPWLKIVVYTALLGTCTESFRWPFGVVF
jgi:hypothetical protein